MVEKLLDSYSESNQDSSPALAGGFKIGVSQSFLGKPGKLSSCKFYLVKTGSPTGSIYAKLYAHSGTYGASSIPTGSALATSDAVNIAGVTTPALHTFTFSGANQYQMSGNYYCLTCEFSGGDGSNYLNVYTDGSSPGHGGNQADLTGTTWTARAVDTCFYVYYYPSPSGGLIFFLSEAWERHKKLWTPDKKLILPEDLGFSY